MATHLGILAWKIPWTEEPIRLQSMRPQRVRHDWPNEHPCMLIPETLILLLYITVYGVHTGHWKWDLHLSLCYAGAEDWQWGLRCYLPWDKYSKKFTFIYVNIGVNLRIPNYVYSRIWSKETKAFVLVCLFRLGLLDLTKKKNGYWVKSEFQVNNSIFFFFWVYVCPKNCIWDLYTKTSKNPLLF